MGVAQAAVGLLHELSAELALRMGGGQGGQGVGLQLGVDAGRVAGAREGQGGIAGQQGDGQVIDGGVGGGEAEDALAALDALAHDLDQDAGLAGAGRSVDQADVGGEDGDAGRLALVLVERLVQGGERLADVHRIRAAHAQHDVDQEGGAAAEAGGAGQALAQAPGGDLICGQGQVDGGVAEVGGAVEDDLDAAAPGAGHDAGRRLLVVGVQHAHDRARPDREAREAARSARVLGEVDGGAAEHRGPLLGHAQPTGEHALLLQHAPALALAQIDLAASGLRVLELDQAGQLGQRLLPLHVSASPGPRPRAAPSRS